MPNLKYFSMFSGIGGFERGIKQAGANAECVGYSEIDKYAIKVYERQFNGHKNYGDAQADLDNIKTILSDKNYDILEICYVNTAKQGQTFIHATNLPAKTAYSDTKWSGVRKILQNLEKTNADIELCTDKKCWLCMAENVSVVERKKNSSLPLNTEMEMDTSTERSTEQAICIASPSKFTTQKNTKSYATTVITLKEGTVYAHIKRRKQPHKNWGDATKINPTELPDFDLLVGGFPCQAFSIAGKRAGFNDTRGTLFFDIARILAEKRPRHLVLENVKGLLSHDSGKTFQTILGVLSDLGYRVEWQVLNSKDFGVPQNRERIYFIGHLRNECRGKVFPIAGNGGKTNELPRHVSNTLTARGAQAVGTYIGESELNAQEIQQLNQPTHSNDRVYGTDGVSPTLNTMQGGNRQPFIAEDVRIRRLTPIECERLQGFPDQWTAQGTDGAISDTQRYKMCGNAVTVNVVEAVMKGLLNHA